MSRDVPLCLIKTKQKRAHACKYPKRRPIEISKYKAASVSKLSSATSDPVGTTRISAVNIEGLSKTVRAYYEVASKKNAIRPDKLAHLNITHDNKDSLKSNEKLAASVKPAPSEEPTGPFDDEEEVFCTCKRPYKQGELMFKCEGFCDIWYHPACVGMAYAEIERQKNTTERWYCPGCLKHAYEIMVTCGSHKHERKQLKFK